jgi:hypothetical protein
LIAFHANASAEKAFRDVLLSTSSLLPLLNRTSRLRKDSIGVGTNQSDCADNSDEDHKQHHGILSDVLACIVCPEADEQGSHHDLLWVEASEEKWRE